jgi:hypothetical protein
LLVQHLGLHALSNSKEVRRVEPVQVVGFGGFLEVFDREFPNRLEHPEPVAGAADQALVDE